MRSFTPAVLVLGLLSLPAFAQEQKASLKVGDPAPKLQVDKWVKGEPVKQLEKGKVYVLECWATWCGPCVQAIPHVTELQKKYKDKGLVVIGMNVWENDVSEVEPFVKKMGDKMDYRVATDSIPEGKDANSGKMAETWMKAAGRNGIPCSFIVDREGKIAWIGHPMSMDKPLAGVIAGTFDPKKEAEAQERTDKANEALANAMRAKDWDKALTATDELLAASPDTTAGVAPVKVYIHIQKKDYKAANAEAKRLSEGENAKDQRLLMGIAYALVGEGEPAKELDTDLALSSATKAADMGGDMAKMAKTLVAKAHAAKGDYAKAVETQTAAMEGVEGRQKDMMQRDLDAYKEKAAAKK